MTDYPYPVYPHGLAAQVVDNDASTQTDDYAGFFDVVDENGTILVRLAGDAVHNHGGVYTRLHPVGHESDKRVKRMNWSGGAADTEVRTMAYKDGIVRHRYSGSKSILDLDSANGRAALSAGDGELCLQDLGTKTAILTTTLGVDGTRTIDCHGHKLVNVDLPGQTTPPPELADLSARVARLETALDAALTALGESNAK